MSDFVDSLDLNQYLLAALDWATNLLLAIAILIVGYWIAGRIARLIARTGEHYAQLDNTLFTFIAALNRFGVETTSIVALLGAAGLEIPFPHRKVIVFNGDRPGESIRS